MKAALSVCSASEYRRGQAAMLLTTFRLLIAREKPERALLAADEALKIYADLGDRHGEAEVVLLTAQARGLYIYVYMYIYIYIHMYIYIYI